MILVLGSSADSVFPRLIASLEMSGHEFAVVDEDHAERYSVGAETRGTLRVFRIRGGGCTGDRPVRSIFVRHAVLRSLDPGHAERLGVLQTRLNLMMLGANCPIANRPQNAYSNYSKPYQVKLLAEAGFEVPKSLVTNIAGEAERFYDENQRTTVIYKGASNVMTLAQILTPERLPRTEYLENSPVLFQEFIAGVDYRVHVVGDQAIVTRLAGPNEDYRRSLLIEKTEVAVVPAELPAPVVEQCIAVTKQLGLAISGIDFKETADGRLVALEINPFPQFTFYEGRSGQSITQCVVDMLASAAPLPNANVFA